MITVYYIVLYIIYYNQQNYMKNILLEYNNSTLLLK